MSIPIALVRSLSLLYYAIHVIVGLPIDLRRLVS